MNIILTLHPNHLYIIIHIILYRLHIQYNTISLTCKRIRGTCIQYYLCIRKSSWNPREFFNSTSAIVVRSRGTSCVKTIQLRHQQLLIAYCRFWRIDIGATSTIGGTFRLQFPEWIRQDAKLSTTPSFNLSVDDWAICMNTAES